MANSILEIGNKIELRALNYRNPDELAPVYVSQLLDFSEESDEILMIAMPIYEGHLVPLDVGKHFEACFSAKKGMYKADCTVLNRVKRNNIYMVEILIQTQLKKFQRREYFRLNCSFETSFWQLNDNESAEYFVTQELKDEYTSKVYHATITDLSGGGARMISDEIFERGVCVVMQLVLADDFKMRVAGTVVSCTRTENQYTKYDLRVKFLFKDKEPQEKIIKFIFEEQRRRMQSNYLNQNP